MKRGDRVTIGGVDYFITRIDTSGKRGQIDLISVAEAESRRDELNALVAITVIGVAGLAAMCFLAWLGMRS